MTFKRLMKFANQSEKEQILEAVFHKQTPLERFEELREKEESVEKEASVKTLPHKSKHSNFHMALTDYFYKELKSHGFNVSKKNDVTIHLGFDRTTGNRYNSMLVDCLDGQIYLSGSNSKDRRVGKLLGFNGNRTSEAYDCMKRSISKLLNKINRYRVEVVLSDLREQKKTRNKKKVNK